MNYYCSCGQKVDSSHASLFMIKNQLCFECMRIHFTNQFDKNRKDNKVVTLYKDKKTNTSEAI